MTSTVSDESGPSFDRGGGVGLPVRRRLTAFRLGSIGRLRANGLDLRNTWQVVAGAILAPLGFAIIVLGWYGAAHGRVVQQQLPYLISGGILGLALMMIGGFLFWAHWLYRIYDQAELHHQAAMREQAEFHRAFLQELGQGSAPPSANGNQAITAASNLVATPNGSNFHTLSCPVVANRASTLRRVSPVEAEAMKPCRICEPDVTG